MTRRRRLIAIFVGVIGVTLACGLIWRQYTRDWRWKVVVDHDSISATDVKIRFCHLRVSHGDPGSAFEVSVSRLPLRGTSVSVIDLAGGGSVSLEDRRSDLDANIVINGGYFDTALNPIGLMRNGGTERSALVKNRPPFSGVLGSGADGVLNLTHSEDQRVAGFVTARQAGPFIIDRGGDIGIAATALATAERSVIAISESDDAILVITTTPASLYDLACVLRYRPESFGVVRVDRALNLDGGPSSGCAVSLPGVMARSTEPRGRIRDAIAFRLH